MPLPGLLKESTPMRRIHQKGRFIVSSPLKFELGPAATGPRETTHNPLTSEQMAGFEEEAHFLQSRGRDGKVSKAPNSDGVHPDVEPT